MARKFMVEVVFQTEHEDPETAAKAVCEALAPLASHPLILVRMGQGEPDQDAPATTPDPARNAFDQIMGSPSA